MTRTPYRIFTPKRIPERKEEDTLSERFKNEGKLITQKF